MDSIYYLCWNQSRVDERGTAALPRETQRKGFCDTLSLLVLLLSYAGVVQYWHTPFGDLHTPGSHGKLDPVVMHHDGSLLVPNTSALHSGLYYCLLQHTEGTTLWPYELHVGHDGQNLQELGEYKQSIRCAAFRFRRDAGSEEAKQAGVSAELFAGAVAASVLLTFVLGFSIGALSRTHVLRWVQGLTSLLVPLEEVLTQAKSPALESMYF